MSTHRRSQQLASSVDDEQTASHAVEEHAAGDNVRDPTLNDSTSEIVANTTTETTLSNMTTTTPTSDITISDETHGLNSAPAASPTHEDITGTQVDLTLFDEDTTSQHGFSVEEDYPEIGGSPTSADVQDGTNTFPHYEDLVAPRAGPRPIPPQSWFIPFYARQQVFEEMFRETIQAIEAKTAGLTQDINSLHRLREMIFEDRLPEIHPVTGTFYHQIASPDTTAEHNEKIKQIERRSEMARDVMRRTIDDSNEENKKLKEENNRLKDELRAAKEEYDKLQALTNHD